MGLLRAIAMPVGTILRGAGQTRMRLLLVEDDAMIGESVREGLAQEGHVVDWVRDGAAAEAAAGGEH